MIRNLRLSQKNAALVAVFTALYVISGFLKISPIIGLPGQAITAASIIAPLIGILLGPYMGILTAFMGGIIGQFSGLFSYVSIVSGAAASMCAGLIRQNKGAAILLYLSLFLSLAFFPFIGPVWVYPYSIWFQLAGLLILLSPLSSGAKDLSSIRSSNLPFAFFTTCLISTLCGQIAGTLSLEATLTLNSSYWLGVWSSTAFLYPIERCIIAIFSALIGSSLYKTVVAADFDSVFGLKKDQKRS